MSASKGMVWPFFLTELAAVLPLLLVLSPTLTWASFPSRGQEPDLPSYPDDNGPAPAVCPAGIGPSASQSCPTGEARSREGGTAPGTESVQNRSIERMGREALPDIAVSYPSFGNPAVDSDIEHWMEHIVNRFESDFAGAGGLENGPDDELSGYGLSASYEVIRPSTVAVSVTFELWMYTGSPRPGRDIITLNYSLLTGQRLQLVDIFESPEKALGLFSEYSRLSLARGIGGGRIDQTIRDGTMPIAENFSSISLTPAGIRVHFQPYQVGSWETGSQFVDIPLSRLAEAGPLLSLWGRR